MVSNRDNMTIEDFKVALQNCVKLQLDNWRPTRDNEMLQSFDLGIHPWYGYIELSFLTKEELQKFGLDFQYDVGDWKYYNFNRFTEDVDSELYKLGQWMLKYYQQQDTREGTLFFEIGVNLLRDKQVQACFLKFNRSEDFSYSVVNPDDPGQGNYYLK